MARKGRMMGTRFVAGWNIPGYLPEMEPASFDTAADAVAFIEDQLNLIADEYWGYEQFCRRVERLIDEIEDDIQANELDWEGSWHLNGGGVIPSDLIFWFRVEEGYEVEA